MEKSSNHFRECVSSILQLKLDDSTKAHVIVQKTLGKFLVATSMTSQQVGHMLLGDHLYHSSRSWRTLYIGPPRQVEQRSINLDVYHDGDDDDGVTHRAFLEGYERRPAELEAYSLHECARWVEWKGAGYTKRQRAFVLSMWPRYSGKATDAVRLELYYRAKVLLHRPWRGDPDELRLFEGIERPWKEVFDELVIELDHYPRDGLHDDDGPDYKDDAASEDGFEEEDDSDDEQGLTAAQRLARLGPHRDGQLPSILGQRAMDRDEEYWRADAASHDADAAATYIKELMREMDDAADWRTFYDDGKDDRVLASGLNDAQQRLYWRYVNHYERVLNGEVSTPVLCHLDGTAGVGKSHFIDVLSRTLVRMAIEADCDHCPVFRVAPSGIAAFNIRGETCHYALNILSAELKKGDVVLLEGARLQRLQKRLAGMQLLIVDEKSMIGLAMLGLIDLRLRDAFPGSENDFFGGRSLLLCGDFGQLPPVGDMSLYRGYDKPQPRMTELQQLGWTAYSAVSESTAFTENMRQADPEQQRFREVLQRVRAEQVSAIDHAYLAARELSQLPAAEQATFRDAIRLYPRKEDVASLNETMLKLAKRPVLRVDAVHNCSEAKKMSEDDAMGLPRTILLQHGAKVMLSRNVWTTRGLTNGTRGTLGPSLIFSRCTAHSVSRAHPVQARPRPAQGRACCRARPLPRLPWTDRVLQR
jgi:hypothetical protein